ncbi:LysR family transcriptional regulator [Paracoccus aminophilus]|uniref:Transcriptional regulator, LysR family n=1 Tax=Paracoccus aminophilus JCM 7686 TaxID=1367847 RepID=S5YIH2_PARAH|nr:LysR substrate-binding domain-containing protein [Paracoccus aminophilus]AGT11278.1 transcriptional regulator, LysR family [Paracoccus aminophilus JCM 7686]
MELKWLEDFVMLASTASFSRAAEARHITQSAFSRRIKQLETWLGAALINRASIPADLTPEGKAFLPVAQDAIRTFYATRDSLRPMGSGRHPTLNLAALLSLTVTLLPQLLERLERALPGVTAKVIPDRGGIEANIDALVSGEADVFLTYAHPNVPMLLDPEQFDWITLGTETILPVIAPRLRDRTAAVTPGILDEAAQGHCEIPYLDYGRASFFGTTLQRLMTQYPFRRRIIFENSISFGLREFALQGWGLCWLPESLVRGDLDAGRLMLASPLAQWRLSVEIRLYAYRGEDPGRGHPLWERILETLATPDAAAPARA